MSLRIGFLSADWSFDFTDAEGFPTPGGSGWYRCHLPAKYLERNGIDAVVAPVPRLKPSGEIMLLGWDDQFYEDFDIIVIQRWMSSEAEGIIRKARSTGQIIINDMDDWYGALSPANGAFHSSHPRRSLQMNRQNARRLGVSATEDFNVNHYMQAIRASSGVTVSTPYLAQKLQACENVQLVRNAIDLDRWTPHPPSDSKRPNLGWMGSTSHRSGDLEALNGVLEPFCERHKVKIVHAGYVPGGTTFEELAGVHWRRMIRVPSVPARKVPTLFDKIEIGLVPLRDVAFNQAKSAINGISCSAAGRPFVASESPEYSWLQRTHGLGRTVRKSKQWVWELERLLDPEERQKAHEDSLRGVKALDMAERWSDWANAYEAIRG